MWPAALALLMALVELPPAEPPSMQTLVYYNARLALRDNRPEEALRLWLVRNAVEHRTHEVSAHDHDMRSVAWAALGRMGLCPDGFLKDRDGAGLWPVATHNYLVRAMRRPPPADDPQHFEALEYGRQRRGVGLHDALDLEELETLRFYRTPCWVHARLLVEAGFSVWPDIRDRPVTGQLMRHLLRQARRALDRDRVKGWAVIEARLFDLNLKLAGISSKSARRARRRARREARRLKLSPADVEAKVNAAAPPPPPNSEEARLLRASLDWPAEEWMSLKSKRRVALFNEAILLNPGDHAPLKLDIIDALIERRAGRELEGWIGLLGDKPVMRRIIWSGERGARLLTLDPETEFKERAVIALHRGVDALERGDQAQAIRDFAYALRWADQSAAAEPVRNLSRRWLSYVAAQHRVTDALLATLVTVVPRADLRFVLEDQIWHAAFAADAESFERCVRYRKGRGALNRRVEALRPLSKGDVAGFLARIERQLEDNPSAATRFIRRFLQRLQAQDGPTRAQLAEALRRIAAGIEAAQDEGSKRSQRRTRVLLDWIHGILEGIEGAPEAEGDDPERVASIDRAVFVGNLRVAPSDTPPWPFVAPEVSPPSVWTPITLRPEAWRDAEGAWVLGWRIFD